jgi:hypothetical protein
MNPTKLALAAALALASKVEGDLKVGAKVTIEYTR